MICKKCGNMLENNISFCNICGERNDVQVPFNKLDQTSQMVNNNINESSNNKKDKFKKIIPIIMFLCLILIFFVGFLIGKSMNNKCEVKESYNDSTNQDIDANIKKYTHSLFIPSEVEKAKNNTELGKNVTINEIFFNPNYNSYSKYKDAYFYGKNNNSIPVEIRLILEYYDNEGYRIEKNYTSSIVYPSKEFVISMTIEDDSLNYEKVKLSYEVNKMKSYYSIINEDYVKISGNLLDGEDINILVENNFNKEISAAVACLYYKNNKMVFVQDAMFISVKPNQKSVSNCYSYMLNINDNDKIEYDDYKIVMFSAYNYDSVNY